MQDEVKHSATTQVETERRKKREQYLVETGNNAAVHVVGSYPVGHRLNEALSPKHEVCVTEHQGGSSGSSEGAQERRKRKWREASIAIQKYLFFIAIFFLIIHLTNIFVLLVIRQTLVSKRTHK